MPAFTILIQRFSHREFGRGQDRGASLIEYTLLIAFIALVCIAAVTTLGSGTSSNFSEATSLLG